MKKAIKNLTAVPLMLLFTASAVVVLVFSAILMAGESIVSMILLKTKKLKETVPEQKIPSRELS